MRERLSPSGEPIALVGGGTFLPWSVAAQRTKQWQAPGKRWQMDGYFVLNEQGEPRLEPDIEAWSRWFEHADRSVARTVVSSGVTVLTTFRGVGETNENGEAPPLFETRVFGGLLEGEEQWSRTRAEALAGHEWLAYWCRLASKHNHGITAAQLR